MENVKHGGRGRDNVFEGGWPSGRRDEGESCDTGGDSGNRKGDETRNVSVERATKRPDKAERMRSFLEIRREMLITRTKIRKTFKEYSQVIIDFSDSLCLPFSTNFRRNTKPRVDHRLRDFFEVLYRHNTLREQFSFYRDARSSRLNA